jgi:hypothetical protein
MFAWSCALADGVEVTRVCTTGINSTALFAIAFIAIFARTREGARSSLLAVGIGIARVGFASIHFCAAFAGTLVACVTGTFVCART